MHAFLAGKAEGEIARRRRAVERTDLDAAAASAQRKAMRVKTPSRQAKLAPSSS
jgi:hypothetical protein